MTSANRLRRQRTSRAHYAEDSGSEEISGPSLRSPRNRPNYMVDHSSDSENAESARSDVTTAEPITQPPTRCMTTRSHPSKRKAQPSRAKLHTSNKRQKVLGTPLKHKKPSHSTSVLFVLPGGKVPPWQSLEHSILTEILRFASHPLYSDYLRPTALIRWLIQMSCLSKSFHDAATSALFYSPPLIPYANGIMNLLSQEQDLLITNYRVKIRQLVVEAKHLLVKKGGIANLADLVARTPLLESLRIVSHHDELSAIWAHPSAAKKTYTYGVSLFASLDRFCPRLTEFEWNGRFHTGIAPVIDMMSTAGGYASFSGLTSVTLMNLNIPEKATDEERMSLQRCLLAALNKLLRLTQLKITNCDALNNFAGLATLQTTQLKKLTIRECPSLTSIGLEELLAAKGQHLEQLSLVGNQSCDGGSWLPGLPLYCPGLQILRIDLTFKDVTSYNETTPFFDDFLPGGSIAFPSSLVEIEITNLRKVDSAQLEACLESLMNTALPSLRRLRLNVISVLFSDYRIRAAIRNGWRDKLERRFLRRSAPPPSSNAWKTFPVHQNAPIIQSSVASVSEELKHRKSNRISRSSRAENPSTIDRDLGVDGPPTMMQEALCDTVEFRVDDQRPAESQFLEQDFLDEEMAGDEEWDGKDLGENSLWGY